MFFSKPKIFYDNDAANGGGGGDTPTETVENTVTEQQQAPITQEVPTPIITDAELKEYNFDSPDALKKFLQTHKDATLSEEEKKQKENVEKANFLQFAAENKLLTVEDNTRYETLKAKSDKEVVFEHFKKEFATDNPEITDEKELEEAAQEEFNYVNKLSDPKGLERAEKKWAKKAKELRSPFETKIIAAQNQFKETQSLKETYPKFDKLVDQLIAKNTPDKLAVVKIKDGDKEVPIEIDITKEDREAMAKSFKTPKSFRRFLDSKPEEVEKILEDKMQGWVAQHKKSEIAAKSYEIGKGSGVAQGSNVGANNPFPLVRGGVAAFTGEETLEQSNARIAKARQQAQGQR